MTDNTEHDDVIEAMARRYMKYSLDGALDQYEGTFKKSIKEGIKDMLKAVAERGWVLARIPDAYTLDDFVATQDEWRVAEMNEFNACLDAIETIKFEDIDND